MLFHEYQRFLFLEEGRFVTMMILSIHLVSEKDGFNHKLFEFLELTSLINLKCFFNIKISKRNCLRISLCLSKVNVRNVRNSIWYSIFEYSVVRQRWYRCLHQLVHKSLVKNQKKSIYASSLGHKKYTIQVSNMIISSTLIALPYVRMQFII